MYYPGDKLYSIMLIWIGLLYLTGPVLPQPDVHLSLGGTRIENNSYVDIDSIGINGSDTDALLCHTVITDGEWYYSHNGTTVEDVSVVNNTNTIVSTRVNNTKIKLFRNNPSKIEGQFHCLVKFNATDDRAVYVNIVDIDAIHISPAGSIIKMSQESFSLDCSFRLLSNTLPQGAFGPEVVWFINSTDSQSLPHGVIMSNIINSGNTYTSSLNFLPLLESQSAMYTCQIKGNGRQADTIMITIFTLQIYNSSYSPMAEEYYSLTCNVSINVTSYQWKKDGQDILNQTEDVLVFPSLLLSDAGEYTCEVEVNSTIYSTNTTIMLEIPEPLSVVVTSNTSNPIRPIGSNISLICSIELSPVVDVPVTVNTVWSGPAGFAITNTAQVVMGSNTTYTSVVNVSSFTRRESGNYTCNSSVTSVTEQRYLNDSRTIASNKIRVTTDVYISNANREVFDNDSVVPTTKSGGDSVLVCHTDKLECCQNNMEGMWFEIMITSKLVMVSLMDSDVTRGDSTINLTFPERNGIFCCRVPNAISDIQTVCITLAPPISIIADSTPVVGMNYTLMCNTSESDLDIIQYQWRKNGTEVRQSDTGSTLFFSPLSLADAGRYSCSVTMGYSESKVITLKISSITSINLRSSKINPIRPDGSNITLYCSVQFRPIVESDISLLMVDAQLFKSNGTPLTLNGPMKNGMNYSFFTQLISFERSDSGSYTCSVTVRANQPSPYIVNSITNTSTINITTGAYLAWNGKVLASNDELALTMVGEDDNGTLLCFTDLYQFYNNSGDLRDNGKWYFPDGTLVGTSGDIYISRGYGVVGLNRKNHTMMPTGRFHCEILNASQILQHLYIYLSDESVPTKSNVIIGPAVGGAVLGALLLIAAGIIVLLIGRSRYKSQQPKHSSQAKSFSESLEAIDSTKLPPEPDTYEDNKGECIELNEYDEVQADEDDDRNFTDTTPAEGECIKSIPLSEFCNHIEQMHANRDKLFEMEYTRLSRLPKFCTSEAKVSHNMPKNRFANILPYDCSRVKLTEIEGEQGSDYINANYLDGYNKPNAYIAAQGPLPNTVGDFWRMVWEKKLSAIAMLTRCFEGRPKCEEYWPVNAGESIQPGHNLTITLKAMLPFAEYSVRKMTVTCVQPPEGCEGSSNSDSSNSLEVVQFHFTGWPDHGVPQNGVVLVNFIWRIRTIHPYSDPCPLLVHCSAGVGRTGAFIVLDSMLERMKEEDNLNIFEFLKQLRAQRVLMVQTQAQYNFIHDVLNELILTGNTEITAPNFRIIMNRLNKVKDGESGYSKQFKILDQVSPTPCVFDCTQANMKFNAEKNRYPHIKPNDRHRVMLREEIGSGRDYINASFINGYRQRGTYIATQVPMENTVNDFWKMIWEYKSTTIVLLCKMTEEGEVYPDFLPDSKGGCMMYGKVEVKFVSQQVSPDYVVKHLELSEVKGADTLDTMTVTLFHYLRWPKNGSPQRSASLLEIIELVNKKQMGSGNKAITVMCNDGVGRTGAFICIHTQMERMKTEGVVDFFQCIKSARIHRAGLVPDVDQYVLCHTVVADYLNDFDAYANFKDLI